MKKVNFLQNDFLVMDWSELESEEGIQKFRVAKSKFQFVDENNIPLNGKMIAGKILAIEVQFGGIESSTSQVCAKPALAIEIRSTPRKLSSFGKIGSTIEFPDYVLSDEWEVMATLYYYEHLDMLNTEITILDRTPSSIIVSIVGKLKYYNNPKGQLPKPNPSFYFQHEFSES